jgi:tetratricopeptide (TPR) repeat protein
VVRRQLVLLGVLAFLAYLPALFGPFLLDDLLILESTASGRGRDALTSLTGGPVTASLQAGAPNVYYRPLSFLSLAADRLIWSDRPFGFHLTNLLLHVGSALILFLLVRRWRPGEGNLPLAVALAWALLPINTEPAIYVSARHDVLFNFLYLLAFLAYLSWKRPWNFLLYGCLGVASFLAKEMAITLPVVVLLHDLILRPGAGEPGTPSFKWACAGHLSLLVVLLSIRLLTLSSSGALTDLSPPDGFLVLSVGWHYLKVLAAPLSYSIDRSQDVEASGTAACCFLAALALTAGLLFTLTKSGDWRRRLVLFACSWSAVSYLPVSNLVPLYSICADRYLYLPLLALAIAFGAALSVPAVSGNPLLRRSWPALGAVLFALVIYRSSLFADERRLYEASLAESPRSPMLHNNLGLVEKREGNHAAADRHYRQALAVAPGYQEARFNLGVLDRETGKYAEADSLLAAYVGARPRSHEGWYQWGLSALAAGNYPAAVERLSRADGLRGKDLGIRYHLAVANWRTGNSREARKILEELERQHPENEKPRLLLERLR